MINGTIIPIDFTKIASLDQKELAKHVELHVQQYIKDFYESTWIDEPPYNSRAILHLFSFDEKKQSISFIKNNSISSEGLISLGMAAYFGYIGYNYDCNSREWFLPEEMVKIEKSNKNLSAKETMPFGDLSAGFGRKILTYHAFIDHKRPYKWHILYFDRNSLERPQGSMGPHMYYTSHLFDPRKNMMDALDQIAGTRNRRGSEEHIKYELPNLEAPSLHDVLLYGANKLYIDYSDIAENKISVYSIDNILTNLSGQNH